MSLSPLLQAPVLFGIHAGMALTAFVLGLVQLLAPKGTLPHRTLGYVWVALMLTIAISSFGIRALNRPNLSWVHLTSIMTLIVLPFAVMHARRGRISRHARAMISLYVGTMVIAGGFTLLPGRLMHSVVFGGP